MDNKEKVCNIIMENRRKISVSAVEDVDSFNEDCIVLLTSLGTLIVKGANFHINKLSVDTGELVIEGDIDSCMFDDKASVKGSFWSKMFK